MESYKAFLKSQGTAGCGAASQHHLFFEFEMIYENWSVRVLLLTVQLQQYVLRQQWMSKQVSTTAKVYSPKNVCHILNIEPITIKCYSPEYINILKKSY